MSARETSFWGWGWADKFPDEGALAAIGEQVSGLLGHPVAAPRAQPTIDAAVLPKPRAEVPAALAGFCTASRLERASHTYGKAYRDLVRGFRGDFAAAPDLVARPRTEEEVRQVLEYCDAHQFAVIPFGGGTSVVGGVEAVLGPSHRAAVSLDLRGLNAVLEVDDVSRTARIQAGATGPGLEAQLGERGLTLRHFPQSFEFSTLGGWIATRAGGHFATLYTHIDDLVESTRLLTPRGVMQTRPLPASGAGPGPDRLVLGSEGALGVITEAWVRVQPRPRFRVSASVLFDDFGAAVNAAREVAQAGLYPSNCRLLDAQEALMNGVAMGQCVLLLAFESADHPKGPWMDRALAIATAHGGQCPKGPVTRAGNEKAALDEGGSWRAAFLEAPYLQNALVSLGVIADTFETACTWKSFAGLHREVYERMREAFARVCGAGLLSCRFTHVYPDGPAPYFTFVAPGRAGAELEQWAELKLAASEALLRAGGTITHHHAVGRVHRPWYERERPALFGEVLSAAKQRLDPNGILNPGVLVGP
jgi:alkyldihydroxyacetonephosphate synthase